MRLTTAIHALGLGVIRDADAGYEETIRFAKERKLKRPTEQAE
jgi:urocanate hydratase